MPAIQFQLGHAGEFNVARCVNTPAGYTHDFRAAAGYAEPIDDSLVKCPEIMMVTQGAFDFVVPELGTISLHAGEMSSPQRFKSGFQIVSTEDDSAYVCLRPSDDSFWERESGFVAAGESIVVTTPPCEKAHVFVVIGQMTKDGNDCLVGSLIPVAEGDTTFSGVKNTHFIHVWK